MKIVLGVILGLILVSSVFVGNASAIDMFDIIIKSNPMATASLEDCGAWSSIYRKSLGTVNNDVSGRFGTEEVSQRVADHVTSGGSVTDSIKAVNNASEKLIANCDYHSEYVVREVLGGFNQNIIDSVKMYKNMSIKDVGLPYKQESKAQTKSSTEVKKDTKKETKKDSKKKTDAKYELAKQWALKVESDGKIHTLTNPVDLEVDSNYVYVIGPTFGVLKYDHDGKLVRYFDVKIGERWCTFGSIDVDKLGNIFAWVEDCPKYDDGKLIKLNSDGKLVKEFPIIEQKIDLFNTVAHTQLPLDADDIAVDSSGNVYLSSSNAIFHIDGEGKIIREIGQFGIKSDSISYPSEIFVDKYDNVIVLDKGQTRLQKFTSDWTLLKTWSVPSWMGLSLVIDEFDNLFYADLGSESIRHIDTNGKLVEEFGQIQRDVDNPTLTSPFGGKEFDNPQKTYSNISGMGIDQSGNIYVTRIGDGIVQKYTPASKPIIKQKDTIKDEQAKNPITKKKDTNTTKDTKDTKTTKKTSKKKSVDDSSNNAVMFDNFSIVPPKGWQKNNSPPAGQGIAFLANPPMIHPSLYAINRSPFVTNFEQVITSLHIDVGACELIQEGKTKLAGKKAYYVEWDCHGMHGILHGVEENGYLYEVGFIAPSGSFKSYLDDAQKSIATFRFIK